MKTYIGCSIIIYNEERKVLIAQRSMIKKKFPLQWETIGGALELEETPEACIRRETLEEIGCELTDLRLFDVYVVREEAEQHVLIVYTGKICGCLQTNCEIERVQWVEANELDEYDFYALHCKTKLLDFFARAGDEYWRFSEGST